MVEDQAIEIPLSGRADRVMVRVFPLALLVAPFVVGLTSPRGAWELGTLVAILSWSGAALVLWTIAPAVGVRLRLAPEALELRKGGRRFWTIVPQDVAAVVREGHWVNLIGRDGATLGRFVTTLQNARDAEMELLLFSFFPKRVATWRRVRGAGGNPWASFGLGLIALGAGAYGLRAVSLVISSESPQGMLAWVSTHLGVALLVLMALLFFGLLGLVHGFAWFSRAKYDHFVRVQAPRSSTLLPALTLTRAGMADPDRRVYEYPPKWREFDTAKNIRTGRWGLAVVVGFCAALMALSGRDGAVLGALCLLVLGFFIPLQVGYERQMRRLAVGLLDQIILESGRIRVRDGDRVRRATVARFANHTTGDSSGFGRMSVLLDVEGESRWFDPTSMIEVETHDDQARAMSSNATTFQAPPARSTVASSTDAHLQ